MEKELLPAAKELGVGIIAYGTLAHGLLGGNWSKERSDQNNFLPIFHKDNIDKNLSLVEALQEIAAEKLSNHNIF
ncbi:Aldo-keto reductase [Desulfosporosinus sp. BG]|nr:Aldo-keto reductase [Desulfosporosinus sp. BG]